MQGGGQEPKVLVAGQLECDSGGTGKVYDPEGIAPTQLAQHGNAVTKIIDHKPTQFSVDGEGIAYCLDTGYPKGISNTQWEKGRRTHVIQRQFSGKYGVSEDITGTLQASRVDKVPMVVEEPRAVLTPDRMEKRQNGRRMKEPGEPMFTLTAQDLHGIVVIDTKNMSADKKSGKSGVRVYEDNCPTLTATDYKDPKQIYDGYRIRKLTPLECFRLQSYPDWWYVKLKLFRHPEYIELVDTSRNNITAQVLEIIRDNGLKEGISDSQLYKMAGNGVTSVVAYEIGKRIKQAQTHQ